MSIISDKHSENSLFHEGNHVLRQYLEVENSPTFPGVEKEKLYEFLAQSKIDEVEAEKSFRAYVRDNLVNC